MSQQRHAIARKLMEVECVTTVFARYMGLSEKLCLGRWQLTHRSVVQTDLLRPPVRIFTAIATRYPTGTTDCKIDLSPALIELLCDLAARLRASHDQHSPGQQLLRIVIGIRMKLLDLRW